MGITNKHPHSTFRTGLLGLTAAVSCALAQPAGAGEENSRPLEAVAVTTEMAAAGKTNLEQMYVGHIEPMQVVEARAQIDGYIETVHFKDGALVKEGELLFTIEQNKYKAQVALNKAALAQAQANLARAEKFYKRMKSADTRSVVQADIDNAESDLLQCKAHVQQAEAALNLSDINLNYTEIRSPINGRIGKATITKGNYVSPAAGPLAVIVQLTPIRAVFSMPDKEYYRYLGGKTKMSDLTARLILPDGGVYPQTGAWDFENNTMNPQTATIAVRVLFDNAEGLLVPQAYVKVVVDEKRDQPLPAIPVEAVLYDTRGSYVYLVGSDNTVEKRYVTTGSQSGKLVSVRANLAVGETIVVRGGQLLHPGQTVSVKQ